MLPFVQQQNKSAVFYFTAQPGMIIGLHPAKERCRYRVMPSLFSWAQT